MFDIGRADGCQQVSSSRSSFHEGLQELSSRAVESIKRGRSRNCSIGSNVGHLLRRVVLATIIGSEDAHSVMFAEGVVTRIDFGKDVDYAERIFWTDFFKESDDGEDSDERR